MRVGVTGGIGSGKTSVCRIFSVLGIPVFDADYEAQVIIGSDRSVREGLEEIAGVTLFNNNILDRQLLASIIFNDTVKLKKVNGLVHPKVFSAFSNWAEKQTSPYVILEAAILFESGADAFVDRVITVSAPESERVERVISRSNASVEDINARMRNQLSDSEREARADFVIRNGERDMVIPVVLSIDRKLRMINESIDRLI